jgi:hypothetical protein
VILGVFVALMGAAPQRNVVKLADTHVALTNPGMGWVFYYYDNDVREFGAGLSAADTVEYFPGVSTVYFRVPWSFVEPKEGVFNWAFIDTPAQRWVAKHKQVALRLTSTESAWPAPAFATPKWVMGAGAKGHFFNSGAGVTAGGQFWEPDYDDEVYLAKLDDFLTAAAARYDGNPEIAFVDVGSFGVWGEGHTIWSTRIPYSASTVERIIELYKKHFKQTLLVANDDFAMQDRGDAPIEYARANGLTLRDDSILVHGGSRAYESAEMAQKFWRQKPVILESQYYGVARNEGIWGDGSKLLAAVDAYHASYVAIQGWPRVVLSQNAALIERINSRLGYRINIQEISWPYSAMTNEGFSIEYRVGNAGVAPCLQGGHVAVTLKNHTDGGIAAVFVDDGFDVRDLPPVDGTEVSAVTRQISANFMLPEPMQQRSFIVPGNYDVFVSVGTLTGTPVLQLALAKSDGQNRYKVGTIELISNGRTQYLAPPS